MSQHSRWQEEKAGRGHPHTLAVALPLWKHETPCPAFWDPVGSGPGSRAKARPGQPGARGSSQAEARVPVEEETRAAALASSASSSPQPGPGGSETSRGSSLLLSVSVWPSQGLGIPWAWDLGDP